MNINNLKKGDVIFIVDEAEKDISSLATSLEVIVIIIVLFIYGDGQIIEAVTVAGIIKAKLSKYLGKKTLFARVSESINFLEAVIANAKEFIGFSYNDYFCPIQNASFTVQN